MLPLVGNYNVTVLGTRSPRIGGCAHHAPLHKSWAPGIHLSLGTPQGGGGYCGNNRGKCTYNLKFYRLRHASVGEARSQNLFCFVWGRGRGPNLYGEQKKKLQDYWRSFVETFGGLICFSFT